jgi:hypothetical protein
MVRTLFLLCLFAILFCSYTPAQIPRIASATAPPSSSVTPAAPQSAAPAATVADDCPITQSIEALPGWSPKGTYFGRPSGPWYVNADRTIWVASLKWKRWTPEKTPWLRPAGVPLEVTGRRLDGDAPPLQVHIYAIPYSSRFQSSIIRFPSEGCWEVTAKAGTSELRFITKIPLPKQSAEPVR